MRSLMVQQYKQILASEFDFGQIDKLLQKPRVEVELAFLLNYLMNRSLQKLIKIPQRTEHLLQRYCDQHVDVETYK